MTAFKVGDEVRIRPGEQFSILDRGAWRRTRAGIPIRCKVTSVEANAITALWDTEAVCFYPDACEAIVYTKPLTLAEKERARMDAEPWVRRRDENLREAFAPKPRTEPAQQSSPYDARPSTTKPPLGSTDWLDDLPSFRYCTDDQDVP